ncbi:MAG: glycosyltransferase [Elusimicrobia bacterium]|nr:glycosyltransferase [Elusimicrobiota bacterium]
MTLHHLLSALRVHSAPLAGACLALGAAQLSLSVRFLLRRLKESAEPARDFSPSVCVVLPCCGAGEGFDENVRAFLGQDYAGRTEFVFVTPGQDDPAWGRLERLLPPSDARLRLLASDEAPARCSGKAVDVLFALRRASPEAEALVFADSDLRVRPDWLRRLVAPLADPSVGAATSLMLYRTGRTSVPSLLRSAWMAAGIPYLESAGVASGQSLALRAADFERLKIAGLWSRSLLEDLALHPVLRAAGLMTAFVGRAMSVSEESTGFWDLLKLTNKWLFGFKVYVPSIWLLGLLVTLAKTYILLWSVRPPVSWGLLALLFAMDAANLWVLSQAYRVCLCDGRGLGAGAILLAPALQLVYAVNFVASFFMMGVRWGRYRYDVFGPQDVIAVPGRR